MALYRRKPTTVDAEQFTDPDNPPRGVRWHENVPEGRHFFVRTMQAQKVNVKPGEWIVKEASGDGYYPIADAEFRRIYEPA